VGMKYGVRTAYGPRWYRSKTEARWAAWFDKVGVEFYYEPSNIALGFCNYIPDFYLPDLGAYFEVKAGNFGETQIRKIKRLAEVTRQDVFLFGDGRFAEKDGDRHGYGYVWRPDGQLYGDNMFTWAVCPICDKAGIALLGRATGLRCRCVRKTVRTLYADDNARLLRAYKHVSGLFI
jgi:hypothetical protein